MLDPHQTLQGKQNFFRKKWSKRIKKRGPAGSIPWWWFPDGDFPGFPKIQVEMPRAGKRGEAGAYPLRKNHKKSGCTHKQTLALGNPGSLKKRRLRRNKFLLREMISVRLDRHPAINLQSGHLIVSRRTFSARCKNWKTSHCLGLRSWELCMVL